MVYTENIEFEWDVVKAISNWLKHGISFESAMTAFDDPFARFGVDIQHSTESEIREQVVGDSDAGVLIVIFTIRHFGKTRIISARRANRKERKIYEERKISRI